MTRLERYRQQLSELEARRNQFMRQGKYMQMHKLEDELNEVRKHIAEAENYEAKPIKELVSMDEIHESGLIPALMECHLAADYLNSCSCEVKDIIKKMGFRAVSIIPDINEIISRTNAFASVLCEKNEVLRDMLLDNDTLINALHKKTLSYIAQRTRPKKKPTKNKTKKSEK